MESSSAELRPPDAVAVVGWSPPASREEADQAILSLSNDIGLILAQLAEDQVAWCDRTGRSPAEYTGWRRRALFAKVHKEGQLRECKRIRAQLSSGGGGDLDALRTDRNLGELLARSRAVVGLWLDEGADSGSARLDAALSRLAEHLDGPPVARSNGNGHQDLTGMRPERVSRAGRPWARA